MLKAKRTMMDVIGVVQHHDAVTGTTKQHLADDYNSRIFKGIEKTNPVYADIVSKLAQNIGFEESTWSWCQRQNETWVDCPISAYADSTDSTMVVATHNAAHLGMEYIELKVPHGHFKVQAFLGSEGWWDAEASVICNDQQNEQDPSETQTKCRMYVK